MAAEVLLIAEGRIATVQLLEQLLAYLESSSTLRARSRLLSELRADDFTADSYPLIVRSFSREAHKLARMLRRQGIPYGYYLDDNFWLLDTATELGRIYAQPSERRRLEFVVKHAATVIVSTPLLGDYVRLRNRNVVQLDSFFDFSLIPKLPAARARQGPVRGGFAASADRVLDLTPVLEDVISMLDEHADLEFEVIGADDNDLPRHPRLRSFGYRASYQEYIAFQRSRHWDFALAPLGSAPSNLYKTDNKFREYAAQGIPGIYEDAPPYYSVRDEETGLLAGKSRSWREALTRYVDDPALRSRVRRAARVDAENRCALENVAPEWGSFFESAPSVGGSEERVDRVRRDFSLHWSKPARAVSRGQLLFAYGRKHLADEGFVATAAQTARFLRKRMPW